MRSIWTCGVVVAGSAVATGCGDNLEVAQIPPIAAVDGWELEVAAPVVSSGSVSASFTARGEGTRAFGTCLVADLHDSKPCTTVADCTTGTVVTPATGHFEYCHAAEGATQKTCWTRNGANMAWCNKVPPPGRVEGTYMTPTVDAAQIAGSGSETRWMAIACLNAGTYPAFSEGPLPPCASSDPAADDYKVYAPSATTTFTAD